MMPARRHTMISGMWALSIMLAGCGGGTEDAAAGAAETAVGGEPATAAALVPTGVYECDRPGYGGMVEVVTGPMFGICDGRAYRDFDGGEGTYSFDGTVLTMDSGPLAGTRYRREGETLFYPINADGSTGPIRCVHNAGKDIDGSW